MMSNVAIALSAFVGGFCGTLFGAAPRFIPNPPSPPRSLREKQQSERDDLLRRDLLDHMPMLQRVHRIEAEHIAYAEMDA